MVYFRALFLYLHGGIKKNEDPPHLPSRDLATDIYRINVRIITPLDTIGTLPKEVNCAHTVSKERYK
jgi:hypothetical protein